jgi:hypothetical protein
MKKFLLVLLSLVAFSPLFAAETVAQAANQPQEVVVKIQQQTLPPPPPPQTTVQKANEWVEFGKNVGQAMDAGLTSLTEHAEKFSKTDVGKFTMVAIAWKIAGRDAVHLTDSLLNRVDKYVAQIIGGVILVAWVTIGLWFLRRNFMKRRIVVEKSGPFWNRSLKYQIVNNDLTSDQNTSFWFASLIVLGVSILIVGTIIF